MSEAIARRAHIDDVDALVVLRESMLSSMIEPDGFEEGWRAAFIEWLTPRLEASEFAMVVAEVDGRVVAGAQGVPGDAADDVIRRASTSLGPIFLVWRGKSVPVFLAR